MIFECFYYPIINENKEVIRTNKNLKEFNFGDKVPTKTLYYNYGKNFAIYQPDEFFVIENSILTKSISAKDLKYPLNLVFNKGTQLTIFSPSDLPSVRLLIKGEHESKKELGDLFFLSIVLNRKIKNIQYKVMSELTNSSRDYHYVNRELDLNTKSLMNDLKMVESKFYNLTLDNPCLKDEYLKYMNFGNKEDMFELSINKYFIDGTEEYDQHKLKSLVWQSKPIYPKFKLDNLINSYNYRE
ncbi:hypothetical protein CHF27_012900 [Romboutsia maritimum]|uniref:Uncharacterized protein n=1 Tax=Romboutsia maritimum TaxID=2020948 RepID=A0A371IPY5_9FIRM|nr:hypothetical protein [Romboutsia maritimum]RDY22538.1 hypothetical protein CHF27_012900 [Romboutsia maritimum]